ncbi:type II secretory pathway component PulF [Gemmobacter caeni]|uniref:Type II secretory pathway component PulF n=1 Tax=Gemmobacter caeni TaxID=589035 RepID=A0A2T6B8H1_9RHOB|nr:type II secretion system F family protein [Gemmobacter caeni]PTX52367.1 type II secretory pathway component PulF [Gemmobacter caeni]TWJ02739.1 type II secretory pathway component PulF [Gemmobacter caeni]
MNEFERRFAKALFFTEDRLSLYQELAALMRTGVSKTDALQMAWKVASDEGRKPKETTALILRDIGDGMRNGLSFGDAVRRWVPPEDAMILEATENSDDFPGYLDRYCEVIRKRRQILNIIIGGLLYPLALLAAVYGIAFYFGSEVVPKIEGLLPTEKWSGAARFLLLLSEFSESVAIPVLVGSVSILLAVLVALPRWAGRGRSVADRLPVFSLYRMYTGVSFLISISSLVQGGLSPINAVERVRPLSSPYVGYRLNRIRSHMLNGLNLGAALHASGTGWPDPRMNLSIKIYAETHDLSAQLHRISEEWMERARERILRSIGLIRTVVLFLVFGVILGIVGGMYALQDQIVSSMNSGF